MGSYYQTCALTNLPIIDGEKVYCFLLLRTLPRFVSECWPTHDWSLTPYIFEGEYDGYGGVDNPHGVFLSDIIDSIKQNLFEISHVENTIHDIPVEAKSFDIDVLIKSQKRDRLFLKQTTPFCINYKKTKLKLIMMKKKLVDQFLDEYYYVSILDNSKIGHKQLCERMQDEFDKNNFEMKWLSPKYVGDKKCYDPFNDGMSYNNSLGNIRISPKDFYLNYFPFVYKDDYGKAENKATPELTKAAIHLFCMHDILNTYMLYTNQSWAVPSNGSTEIDTVPLKLKMKLTKQGISDLKNREY